MRPVGPLLLLLAVVLACGCAREGDEDGGERHLHFWHMFNRQETDALNQELEQRRAGPHVETSLLSFARGQTILGDVLRAGRADCPDLARIDATWLPGLVEAGLLQPVPDATWRARAWLPEAAELATWKDTPYALPQAITGLVLLHRALSLRSVWPPRTMEDLEAAARELTHGARHGLGLRMDGYWFIAFLRGWGGDALDAAAGTLGVDRPEARRALERFAALFAPGGVSPPPDAPADQAEEEVRRFRAGEIAILVQGPWAIYDLTGGTIEGDLTATAFPRDPAGRPAAPRGGQLYVVPRCAPDAAAAWALALELTEPALQAGWARRFGVVPVTREALEQSGRLSNELYAALAQGARMLPRHPLTAQMFDDLSPAIEAVVVGDATADEAMDGLVRAWQRLVK